MQHISFITKNDGQVMNIANGQYRTIISGKQTDGEYAIIEMSVPPGAGPAPHAHKDIEEVFYIVTGELEFRSDNGISKNKEGDTVRIPRGGAVHAFRNTGESTALLICTVHPSGLEEMFQEVSAAGAANAKTIAEKFGNQLYPMDYFDRRE